MWVVSALEPILVSVPEAARMLSVCRATFYKLLETGDVRAVKHGRRTLIPVTALRAYAASLPEMQPTRSSSGGGVQ